MRQDEVLYKIADKVKSFAVIYVCDIDQVPDFNQMYELYDPCTIMFFFRNKHIMCDFGTGNNNKLNWVLEDKQELIDIIETIYRGAKKGRGLVVSPKGMSRMSLPCWFVCNANHLRRLFHPPPLLDQRTSIARQQISSPLSFLFSSAFNGTGVLGCLLEDCRDTKDEQAARVGLTILLHLTSRTTKMLITILTQEHMPPSAAQCRPVPPSEAHFLGPRYADRLTSEP
jgi:hypothetical protein